jgi:hypothetical protein
MLYHQNDRPGPPPYALLPVSSKNIQVQKRKSQENDKQFIDL